MGCRFDLRSSDWPDFEEHATDSSRSISVVVNVFNHPQIPIRLDLSVETVLLNSLLVAVVNLNAAFRTVVDCL